MNIYEIKNIKYKYDKYDKSAKNVLDDISFDVAEKDFIAIVGKTGSGKSTLISHLNGILKADSGDILYKGKSIYEKDYDLTKLRFSVGVVFQYPEYQLFSETVIDDISFGAIKKGYDKDEAYKKSEEVMKLLNIYHLKDESPFTLSGGEKRKVAFAGVYVMDPEILILDEPEAGLDSVSKNHMFQLLKKINNEYGKTIIFITHDLDDACEYANKVIVLNEGKVMAVGEPKDIFNDEKLLNECKLGMPYSIEIYKKLGTKNIVSCKYEDVIKAFL